MDWGKGLGRKVGEQPVTFVFTNEIGKFIVPSVDFVGAYETPFADVYPFIGPVRTLIGEGIAVDDIFGQDIAGSLDAVAFALGFEEGPVLLREIV